MQNGHSAACSAAMMSWRPLASRSNARFSLYKTARPVIVYFSFTWCDLL